VSIWLVVWFVVGIVTTVALVTFLVALGRHALILGRTARQAQDAIAPLADDIARGAGRAATKTQGFRMPGPRASGTRG
jgi:hypothetical protein